MEINRYKVENDILYVYIDMDTEFSKELGEFENKKSSLNDIVKQYVRKNVPNFKGNLVKIIAGATIISSVSLTGIGEAAKVEASSTYPSYTVVAGDTISEIAEKFNVSQQEIYNANKLSNSNIYIGQNLTIPVANQYVVSSGDSLSVIAKKFGVSVDRIKSLNQLSGDRIFIGQTLLLPNNTEQQKVAPQIETSTYKVISGDSLSVIANKLNTTVDQLKALNGLAGDTIYIGQELEVPKQLSSDSAQEIQSKQTEKYIVKAGDSLSVIAQQHRVTTAAIKEINNLTTDTIYIGQELTIPTSTSNQTNSTMTLVPDVYTVEQGDNLTRISNQFGLTVEEVKRYNHLNSDTIYVGQKLSLKEQTVIKSPSVQTQPSISYSTHIVRSGDNIWDLSVKYGIPQSELLKVNNLSMNSMLSIGQKLTIPNHNIPVKETVSERHGELLSWWTEAQYVFPIGKTAKVTDFRTGKVFYVKRTIGANHADSETVSMNDTTIAKSIWGGFSWAKRAVIVEVDGRKIAASMTFAPHGVEYISNNGINGHFDIHFKDSTRHKDGQITQSHQDEIKIAAGVTAQ